MRVSRKKYGPMVGVQVLGDLNRRARIGLWLIDLGARVAESGGVTVRVRAPRAASTQGGNA